MIFYDHSQLCSDSVHGQQGTEGLLLSNQSVNYNRFDYT